MAGAAAGTAILAVGSAAGQSVIVGHDWRLALLQVTLGPVLEEVVFRGYLCALLLWSLGKILTGTLLNWLVITAAAVVFALAHLAQPGVSWLQLACITATGCLYGWIRFRSVSTATAAVSHAAYNFTLYVSTGLLANI
jgi:membrane protease YdiL (CAAX protease family)